MENLSNKAKTLQIQKKRINKLIKHTKLTWQNLTGMEGCTTVSTVIGKKCAAGSLHKTCANEHSDSTGHFIDNMKLDISLKNNCSHL